MPSPVLPSAVCATVPSASADICTKMKLIFLEFPKLICQWFQWAFDANGMPTSDFMSSIAEFKSGDFKWTMRAPADDGWLLCGGQEVSRTDYAGLFAVIGTTFGAGNGSTTFNVPDGRQSTLIMYKNAAGIMPGDVGGAAEYALTTANLPSHRHSITGYDAPSTPSNQPDNRLINDDDWGSTVTTSYTGYTGSNTPFSLMQPYIACYLWIKT